MVISSLMINRHIAITCVNVYYELKEEGNNNINIEEFKKSFVKFIVSYMKYTTKFTEEFAERVFKSLYTLDWTNENICDKEYGFTDDEITRLFISMKNHKKITNIKNNSDNIRLSPKKEEYLLDVEHEENDCVICDWHGYDSNWLEEEKRGKFYYSIPYKLNEPVCHYCVNKEENIEEYIYLKSNDLIKCGNCNNIWDGCAQCNCYMYYEYDDNVDNTIEEENFVCSLPPNRPVPYPESYKNNKKIEELEERNLELKKENNVLKKENNVLIDELTKLKDLMEELKDLMEELFISNN